MTFFNHHHFTRGGWVTSLQEERDLAGPIEYIEFVSDFGYCAKKGIFRGDIKLGDITINGTLLLFELLTCPEVRAGNNKKNN